MSSPPLSRLSSSLIHTVLACSTLKQFQAAALNWGRLQQLFGEGVMPVLFEDSKEQVVRGVSGSEIATLPFETSGLIDKVKRRSDRDMLAELQVASIENAQDGSSCCVVRLGDSVSFVGAVHALATRKKLLVLGPNDNIEKVGEEIMRGRSVVFALSSRECSAISCDQLSSFMDGFSDMPWGILTSSTPSKAAQLVCRIRARIPPSLARGIVYRVNEHNRVKLSGLEEYTLPNHPSEVLRALTLRDEPFVMFCGHGRSYCALDGNLCSRIQPAEAGDLNCVEGLECVYSADARIPAQALRADVIILNGCATAAFRHTGPDLGNARNLGVQLLDGFASAVISPYRNYVPLPFAPYMVWLLARRGESLGRICSALNQLSAHRLHLANMYILLGDPDAVVFKADRDSGPADLQVVGNPPWQVDVPVDPGQVQSFRLLGLPVSSDSNLLHALVDQEVADRALITTATLDGVGGQTEFFAAWDEKIHLKTASVCLTFEQPLDFETLAMIGAFVENVRFEKHWLEAATEPGSEPRPAKSIVAFETLISTAESALTRLRRMPLTSSVLFTAAQRLQAEILKACEDVSEEILNEVVRRARSNVLWLARALDDNWGVVCGGSERIDAVCARCGSGLVKWQAEVGLWPLRRRYSLECERCMVTLDVGEAFGEVGLIAPDEAYKGCPFEVRLCGSNATRNRAILQAAIAFDGRLGPARNYHITPQVHRTLLQPGDSFNLPFDVMLDNDLLSHGVYAHGIVMLNGSVSYALKRINLRLER